MKKSVTESLWLSGLASITIILVHWTFSDSIKGVFGQIDIELSDTYFATDAFEVSILVFFNLAFWVYLLRSSFFRFKNQSSNWVLFFASLLLIFITSWTIRMIGMIEARSNWNVIPPVGLPEGTLVLTDYTYWVANNYLVFYQFLQAIVLAFCAFKIGQHKKEPSI